MGHKAGDGMHWNHYRNGTSTVDFRTISHTVDQEDLTSLSSVGLNCRIGAPTRPSEAAYRHMYEIPEILILRYAQLSLLGQVLAVHTVVPKATEVVTPLLHRYREARQSTRMCVAATLQPLLRASLKLFSIPIAPQPTSWMRLLANLKERTRR